MQMRKNSVETVKKILELRETGLTHSKIGQQLGLSRSTVSYHLSSRSLSVRMAQYSIKIRKKAKILVEAGLSNTEAAKKIGVSRNTVALWKEHNFYLGSRRFMWPPEFKEFILYMKYRKKIHHKEIEKYFQVPQRTISIWKIQKRSKIEKSKK